MEDIQRQYDAIFVRKSVRKYKPEPLTPDVMFDLQRHVKELEPLLPEIPYQIEVLTGEKPGGRFVIPAPQYLLFYSKADEAGAWENCGYILEQFSLLFTSLGLGSCWLGKAKPPETMRTANDLDFIAMLAFGTPDEPLTRTAAEFKRNPIESMTDVAEEAELLEAVRLAPSAINGQPWMVSGVRGDLLFSRRKQPVLVRAAMTHMNRLDMGIALCHFRLAAAMAGKPIRISLDPSQDRFPEKRTVPNGYLFTARVTY
ncbi:MAG: nitroreductase [Firmicutes bacterium]|nr:nitroreductase [Bacillota bacterium]